MRSRCASINACRSGGPTPGVERAARIAAVGAQDVNTPGERVILTLEGDGVPRYLRVYRSQPRRWAALWEATGVEPPADQSLRPGSDFLAALDELQGCALRLEIVGDDVIKILAPLAEAAE
jgi:hypothetical protein